jgi:DNA-binding HxlR family transcriptional regulator
MEKRQPESILIANKINHTSMKKHTMPAVPAGNCDELRAEVRNALGVLTGKWKLEILFLLGLRLHRFGELRRAIPGITQHMLTTQLRELEADGLVKRSVYPEVPPRVEYEMTAKGRRLGPVFDAILKWSGCSSGQRTNVSPVCRAITNRSTP